MEKCPNCGKLLPKGKQVHDECIDEFIEYLQEQWKKDVMIGTQKFILLILHHSNNVLAVVDDKEMSVEQKVQALASIQKKLIEREEEYIAMVGDEIPLTSLRRDFVYAAFKGLKEPLSPMSQIRDLYEQTYPEYC